MLKCSCNKLQYVCESGISKINHQYCKIKANEKYQYVGFLLSNN